MIAIISYVILNLIQDPVRDSRLRGNDEEGVILVWSVLKKKSRERRAEREGFEPSIILRRYTLSKRAH
jgi:hypothetical protein